MKRINVTVTTDHAEKVQEAFEKLNVPVFAPVGTQDGKTVSNFSVLVPDELVDNSIDELTKKHRLAN